MRVTDRIIIIPFVLIMQIFVRVDLRHLNLIMLILINLRSRIILACDDGCDLIYFVRSYLSRIGYVSYDQRYNFIFFGFIWKRANLI